MMKKITTLVAALALTGMASAAQITDVASFGFPLSPGTETVQLDQFDDSLGTLNWIKIEITGKVQSNVTVENDSVLAAPDAALEITSNFSAAAPSSTNVVVAMNDSLSASLDPTDGTKGSGSDFHDYGLIDIEDTNSSVIVMNFAPFVGTGEFDVDVIGSAGFVVSGTTDSSLKVSNLNGMGEVKVTYDYVVPEPASMALIGLGGMLMIGRRKK
ncbi:PEP-CTERM sorting domain-containing protein [Planctomycetota bacterium]|nr:PEP-CTERM sorting domain-containing protein [Planctomycetota bacterium]